MAATLSALQPSAAALRPAIKIAAGGVAAVVLLVPVAIAFHAGLYHSFVDDPLSGWGMWGSFAIYLSTRPGRKECAAAIGLAVLLRAAYDAVVGEHGYPGSAILAMGTFLGLAGLALLGARSLREGNRRGVSRQSLIAIAVLSYMGVFLAFYISFAKLALPRKYDYYLYAFDSSLGFHPSFAAGRLVRASATLALTLAMVYNSLGFWLSLLYAVHAGARARYPIAILKMLVANAVIGFSLYFLCPAIGPKCTFPSYPDDPGAVYPAVTFMSGLPNAMPSLHFAAALLIFWLSKPWKWLYRITGVFCALTALATLGLGEHYLVDLVVAVPYALAMMGFCAGVPERRTAIAVGASMLLGWLVFLRGAYFPKPLSWALIAATLATAAILEQRLAAAAFAPEAIRGHRAAAAAR
jgi:hypothetical protein